jgi:L-alanine-DL-glutamate epimerase-like enolase superfamily enzyme
VRIRRLEPIALRLPLRRPVKMASEVVSAAENVLVRLETADGIVGWGEAASAPTMTGETLATMVRAIAELAPLISDTEDAHAVMHRLPGNHGAKAAIDIALHDAMGKRAGKPVCELLGGVRRSRVALMWTLASDVAEAREKLAAGYRAFKIKVGIADPAADVARTAAICAELRGADLVCADANQGWSRDDALRYVRGVEALGLAFVEQPVAADDLAGMAELAAASRVPIAFDEGVHSLDDIRRHHAAGCAGGSLKAIKLGGLRGIVAAAELCTSLGMRVNLACKIAESGIAAAALLHAAATVPALEWAVSLTSHHLEDDLIATPLAIAHGHAEVPRGAGLGVEVREPDLRRYRI